MGHILDSVISNSPVAPTGGEAGQRSPDARLTQEVSTGPDSTLTDVKLNANIYLSDTDYYFELLPSELGASAAGEAPSYEPLPPTTPLRVGQKYRIRVSLSKNQYRRLIQSEISMYRLEQVSFKLRKEVLIQLSINSNDQNVLDAVGSISPGQGRLSLDNLGQSQDFEFTIQKGYKLDIPLELSYLGGPNANFPYHAAMLTLRLEGREPLPPPPEILQLSTKVAPPPDAVVLYVSEGNEGSLMLRGWLGGRSDGSLTLEVGAFGWVDPENCVNVETYLQKLRDSFYDYNIERAASVAAWFEKALRRFDKRCSILIVDEAGALIPWEMFKLPDGRYLGAHALIVRWAETQYAASQEGSSVGAAKYEGRLSAYVHPLDVATMSQLPEMSRLLPSYNQTPLNLQRDLRSGGAQVGLVYLCYGGVLDYGDEQNCMTQLSRFKPYEKDVRIRFDLIGGKLKPRPVFFVNAPYSGRMHKSGQQWCGLARATLKQVAASYIGTLGPVEPSYAARFAQKLLEEATSDKGVRPAELLREMRVQAIEQLNNEDLSEEDYERAYNELAYPFMYVHYGHPQDWLKITRAPEPAKAEGGDEHV